MQEDGGMKAGECYRGDTCGMGRLWVMTVLAFLCVSVVAALVITIAERSRTAAERARAEAAVQTYHSAIAERIDRAMSATYALAALVREGNGKVGNFDSIAREMLSLYPGVDSLQLAPDGVVTFVVPLAGNEKAIGHDLLKDPVRNKEAFLARSTRELTLAGPFSLIQGGKGAVGRLPVFLSDGAGAERFWGFTSVLIRFPDVLAGAPQEPLKESGYGFVLWRLHPDTGKQEIIASSGQSLADPVEKAVKVPNGQWILSVAPISGWGNPGTLMFQAALGFLFSVTVASLVHVVLRQPIILRRDIAERTRELEYSRAMIEESEQRWQFALEGAGDGVWDWNLVTNEIFYSRQWKAMLGFAEDEISNSFSEWENRVHPDDREYAEAAVQDYLEGRTSVYSSEHRLLCKDGSYKWILDRGTIISRDEEGRPLRFIGTHTDITGRKEMEMTLHREKNFIEAVMDSIPGMLYVYDEQGHIIRWNRKHEEMTGYSSEELSRMHILDWYKGDEEAIAYIKERIQKALDEGYADAEADLQRKDGTKIPMYFTAVPMTVGGRTYFLGIGIDVTQRKKAEKEKDKLAAQLLQAQKMEAVGRLAGGVAHDFNNMLAVMFIALELIRMNMSDNDPLLHHLQQIERAAMRSRDIARQLLAFSRQQIIAPRAVALNEVIAETEKTIIRLIGEDIDVRFVPGSDLANILIDPTQIDQILINLALNARDAMPHGGALTIETANAEFDETYCRQHDDCSPGRYVRLSVSDEGTGMDKEMLDTIFEPFFTTKEVGKGTGLGLAMVYGVMKQNDGFLNVYSEIGKGTTFNLYFPSTDIPEQRIEDSDSATPPQGSGTILLVEDDAMLRRVTKTTLETLGYGVAAAATPAEAMDIVQNGTTRYGLLLTDVVMPGMNGKQLSEKICEMCPGIRVLFMSGYTENTIVHRGVLDAGLNFIQKPFSIKSLARKIQDVLNG